MTFAAPWALLALLAVPFALWAWRWRRRGTMLFSQVAPLRALPTGHARSAEFWGRTLRLVGLTFLIVAVAGPRWPDRARTSQEGIALALVVDVSQSMAARDFEFRERKTSRLEGAQTILAQLLLGGDGFPGRPNDHVAVVAFAARPETVCPLTPDVPTALKILQAQKPREDPLEASTNPGDALGWAVLELDKARAKRKAILLLTDGESNVPGSLTPRQGAQLAGNLKMPIYALDLSRESDPKVAEKIKASLAAVAQLSQGGYYRADDETSLKAALAAIDGLERSALSALVTQPFVELYPWFAGAGLVCWLTIAFLEAMRWSRLI